MFLTYIDDSLHYIQECTFQLQQLFTSECGKFKLAKQQDSSIRPTFLLFHSKDYILVRLGLNEVHSLKLQYLHLNQPNNKNLIF